MKILKIKDTQKRFMTIIYGPPGTGKTKSIESLPGKTLLIDFDHGTASLDPNSNVDIIQPGSMLELIGDLYEIETSDYDNIVLDTVTKMQDQKVRTFSEMKIKEWGKVSSEVMKVIEKLDFLSIKGKNVILLCQEKILNEDDRKNIYSTLDVIPSIRGSLTASARAVGRTAFKINPETQKAEYFISFKKNPHAETKLSVFGIDDSDVTSLKEILERLEQN